MKKFISFVFFIVLMSSCEIELPKEKFFGNYSGNVQFDTYINAFFISSEIKNIKFEIYEGDFLNRIIIDGQIEATVSGNSYTITEGQQYEIPLNNGYEMKLSVDGSGYLNSNQVLSISWTLRGVVEGNAIKIQMSGDPEKIIE